MYALKETVQQWRDNGILVDLCDFTTYPKLDVFPPQYVIFLELIDTQEQETNNQQLEILQNIVDSDVERELCKANNIYQRTRNAGKLDSLVCILVRNGIFSTFRREKLITDQISPLQIKPHRLLKDEYHIQFFYDNQINTSSS